MKIESLKKKYLIATIILAALILYFSVIPVMSVENIELNAGTLRHLAVYFLFAFAIYKTTDNPKIAFLSSGTYGMLIECVQYFIPYRTFSLFDILLNYAGACFILILKRKS
jgi:VanZ family protein